MRRIGFSLACAILIALSAIAPSKAAGSPSVDLSGAVDRPARLSLEDLRKLPTTSAAVFFHTGHGATQAVFTGVSLWTLLREAGIKLTPGQRNEGLHKYVVAKGADGYYAVIALAELDPEFGGQQAFLAYAQDGKPLDGARLIMPGDKGGGRNVMDLARIEVRNAEP